MYLRLYDKTLVLASHYQLVINNYLSPSFLIRSAQMTHWLSLVFLLLACTLVIVTPAKWFDNSSYYLNDDDGDTTRNTDQYGYHNYNYSAATFTTGYILLSGPITSFTVICLVLCCISWSEKHLLNRILSCKLFTILGRLTYCLSLVHLIPIYLRHYDIVTVKQWSTSAFVSMIIHWASIDTF